LQFLNNQTQQFFDSDFLFPSKRTWNWQFSESEGFLKPEPVVIKEIDTHPTSENRCKWALEYVALRRVSIKETGAS